MISPTEAEQLIEACALHMEDEHIMLKHALGRVLAEPLVADAHLPSFDRVMMDGIAIRFNTLNEGIRNYRIQDVQRAGQAPLTLASESMCIEVMTGAVCPIGCDTVVPYEHIRIENEMAHIDLVPSQAGKNVHATGSDKRAGDVLVEQGTRIGAAEIGIAASIGKTNLRVVRLPRILICSTGDELVEIDEQPLPHQIRRSNVYALHAMIQTFGIQADTMHLPDDREALMTSLHDATQRYDSIILSGGVSKGKFDLLPEVMQSLEIETIFHGIAQRPGKPMWFGKNARVHVFALPGNPVSTLACAARYVLPWLSKQMKKTTHSQWVSLKEPAQAHEKMTLFIPVTVKQSHEGPIAETLVHKGSGDFSALSGATGFVEVPCGTSEVKSGTLVRYFSFD
jgi:molybdopterin molybdotransferase